MPDKCLIISFPIKQPSRLPQPASSPLPVPYLYLGENYLARRTLEARLGKGFVRLEVAKLLDQVADEIRAEHVAWIDELNRKYGGDLEWWFGTIASRHVYSNKLFQYSCYLEVLARMWDTPETRPRLVFVESLALARTIGTWASEQGIQVLFGNLARWQPLRHYLNSLLGWGYFAVSLLLRQIAARTSRQDSRPTPSSRDLAIVDTFVHDSCLTEEGVFTDHYFPHMHEFLAARGFDVLVHPVLYGFRLHYLSIYRRLRRSETRFIIPEDFLRSRDYFAILTYPLRAARRRIRPPRFRGFELTDLITEAQRNLADGLSLTACMIYRLFLRLGELGLRPKIVIDWYENQVIDKALIAAARRVFPQARIIGAQLFLHLSNFLNLFPSPSEAEAGLVPHLLLGTSEYQCTVARSFSPNLPCAPAAALRQTHIFEATTDGRPPDDNKAIVVLLPFDLAESVEILEILRKALEHLDGSMPILVKCHPDFQPGELVQVFGKKRWPDRFKIFRGDLPQALDRGAMVISSNSSSMIEAAARGIPAIFLGRETALNQKILLNSPTDLIVECFSVKELVAAIQKYRTLSPEDIAQNLKLGKKVRDLFFLPVTHETMLPFITG
jgi:hypothetical protein